MTVRALAQAMDINVGKIFLSCPSFIYLNILLFFEITSMIVLFISKMVINIHLMIKVGFSSLI